MINRIYVYLYRNHKKSIGAAYEKLGIGEPFEIPEVVGVV